MKSPALQYTIRGVPPEVDRVLRQRAKDLHKSINQVVLDELSKSTIGPVKYADYSDLVGKWQEDPGFDEMMEFQRKLDELST